MGTHMFGSRKAGEEMVVCANPECPEQRFPAKDLLFICPGRPCPGLAKTRESIKPKQKERYPDQFLFRAERFAYSVPCPFSPHTAFVKVCPHCWARQPAATGQTSTIAVIGSSFSGKTCYITALIRQIEEELARRASFRMALHWDDQDGFNYFDRQRRHIFDEGVLPDQTHKNVPVRSLQITIRFPVHGLLRGLRVGSQGVVSLVFPDPSGEVLQSLEDAYFLHTLFRAQALILMVDPFGSPKYLQRLKAGGQDVESFRTLYSADRALDVFITNWRRQANQRHGKIPKDLAVVLTKCDEEGVFDPDDERYGGFPVQAPPYSRRLFEEISRRVEQHLELELRMPKIGTMANENFRNVGFFAASALGKPPTAVEEKGVRILRIDDPKPRRVEEPLLWILHKWGYW